MICSEEKKEKLYRDFHPKVISYILSHTINKSEAEDIASEVFVKVYSSLDKYDESKASLSTWIYTITKNTVINHIKKQRFTLVAFTEIADISEKNDRLETEEMLERLNEELSKLPEKWQDIVILHYRFGLSHKEISEKVNLSYVSTRKQYSLAIAELRRRLLYSEKR